MKVRSHDFLLADIADSSVRTPLNAIINYTELALYGEVTDKETRENLENSLRASHSLIYVIEDLLNLAAADEGDVLMPEEHFDLSRTVDEVVEVFAVEAERRGTELVFSNKFTRPGALLGDARRFREVVSHLINNAFQHAGNGTVIIGMRSLTEDDDAVLIEIAVEDCGAGMSEKDLDNLFQYFELFNNDDSESDSSSDNPRVKSPINLGLGLAVVSRFVRNTKGHLRIRSEIGKGTTVAIIVPFRVARDLPIRTSGSLVTPPQGRLPLIFGIRGSSITGIHEQTSSIKTLGLPGSSVNAKLTVPDILSPPLSAHVGHSNISERGSGTSTSSPPQSVDLVSPYQEGYPFPSVNAPQDQTPYRHLSVLIAEDNPINSRMLEHRLSKLGHTVHVATNGQACVDVFASSLEPFDVILVSFSSFAYLLTRNLLLCLLIRRSCCTEHSRNVVEPPEFPHQAPTSHTYTADNPPHPTDGHPNAPPERLPSHRADPPARVPIPVPEINSHYPTSRSEAAYTHRRHLRLPRRISQRRILAEGCRRVDAQAGQLRAAGEVVERDT
jgi:CheY-like chemotaxis protein